MSDTFEPSVNELMKRALAVPLSGKQQIVPLDLPQPAMPVREWGTILTGLDADFALWEKRREKEAAR